MQFSFYEVGMKQPSQVLVRTQAVGANILLLLGAGSLL